MALVNPTRLPSRNAEVRAGLPGTQGKVWGRLAPGRPSNERLRITCNVEHTSGRDPNKATIKLFNLSEASIQFLQRAGTVVQVFVGERIPGLLFRGDVSSRGIRTKVEVPNAITAIEAADGQRTWRESKISRTWAPNTPRDVIITDALAALVLPRGFISPALLPITYSRGFAFSGRARDLLDAVLQTDEKPRWSIQDGRVNILLPKEVLPGNAIRLNPETGLKLSPTRTKDGISFKSVLNVRARPGVGVELESRFIRGLFRITKVKHSFDSRGILWETSGEAVDPAKG